MDKENQEIKYENNKFLPGGKPIEGDVCSTPEDAITALNDFLEQNKLAHEETNKKFRLVLDQHGGINNKNDIKLQSHIETMVESIADKGYKNIVISNLACHGGGTQGVDGILQSIANNKDVNITLRMAPKGRITANGLHWTENRRNVSRMTTVTLGKDGIGLQREKKVFIPQKLKGMSIGL